MKSMNITIFYPNSVDASEIRDYAQEALEHWGGQRNPEDHLFATVKAPKKRMKIGNAFIEDADLKTLRQKWFAKGFLYGMEKARRIIATCRSTVPANGTPKEVATILTEDHIRHIKEAAAAGAPSHNGAR
jgi:hypothetical protein